MGLFSMFDRVFYVYILACKSRRLYIGVTGGLRRRVFEHKSKALVGFTKRYNIDQLVYYEAYRYIHNAIRREKQLKNGPRKKKIELIESTNPEWKDLAADWAEEEAAVVRDSVPFRVQKGTE
ncbi:MAG TPA: GIY-YIG nuclease family protein [bacterium]|jgi:putative endonuclease